MTYLLTKKCNSYFIMSLVLDLSESSHRLMFLLFDTLVHVRTELYFLLISMTAVYKLKNCKCISILSTCESKSTNIIRRELSDQANNKIHNFN